MREPLKPEIEDTYDRPNQSWMCGLTEEGLSCPLGPMAHGCCSHAVACHPLRDGDRWICNRSELRGGPCVAGPTPDGECCVHYSCTPVRSLRSQRGRFVWVVALATLGGLCMILSSSWRNEFLTPGPLSVHHAQLVARSGDQTQRCASCHAAGNQSLFQWLSHPLEPQLAEPTQSSLCMECHQKEFPVDTALFAHGVDQKFMSITQEVELTSRNVDPRGKFACSTCHREHHGATHDLTFMSNTACQACHAQQFQSFATDHPEFNRWPNERRTRIAFDHTAHQAKHFPAEKQEFACQMCHEQSADGFQQTLSYEASCAKCHDSDLETSWQAGLTFVSLPMIDAETLSDAGHDVGNWPEQATGDFDGALAAITKFLLLEDQNAVEGMQLLGVDFDFFDVDPDDPTHLAAAANVIGALQTFLTDLATQGHTAIGKRLEKILGRALTGQELAALTAHISSENMTAIGETWFAQTRLSPPDKIALEKERIDGGGWIRDDNIFALRYQPSGHADPWLTAWIDLLAEATHGPRRKLAEGLLLEMMKPTAPGMCGSCHSVDRTDNGGLEVHWFAQQAPPRGVRFTLFSHAPHTMQPQLADCTACHRLDKSATVMETYKDQAANAFAAGFHAMAKQDCASCHKPGAAGDGCTQCHQYHALKR